MHEWSYYSFKICIIFCKNELFLFFKCPVSIPAYKGLAKLASIVYPTSVFGGWSFWFANFAGSQCCMAKLACKQKTSNICLSTSKNVFDSVLADIQNAEQEMFEKFGGGVTSASKDRLFKLCHVRQTMLVSIARP